MYRLSTTSFVILSLVCLPQRVRADAPTISLAKNGKPQLPIVVAKNASDRIRKAAATLAGYLTKITKASFQVEPGNGADGIVVGLPSQFPAMPFANRWRKPTAIQRENYLLRSYKDGVYVLGATDAAVEHAVWDLLYRVGYRQFFPGKTWEFVPSIRDLSVAVDADEAPDYYSRRIWYGYGLWGYNSEPYRDWCAKNRATMGIALNTGHSYAGIIRANIKEFNAHPEYFALLNGKRNTKSLAQLCLSNKNLRMLVVRHALNHFEKNPDADSISMDPNDGGGWCECEQCQKMGKVSDRVVTLANEVAEAVNRKYDGKYVGMYAYAYHSPPPTIRVHPNVIVSVATGFIKGGYTLDELIQGWSKQGATLGIREYYSVHTWDRDMPAKARGGRLQYLVQTIPEFHAKGARFMSAESSDNWGPNGLGYYVASRMLWDVGQAKHAGDIVDDFLTKAFGAAKEPMREFYRQIDGSRKHLIFQDQLGRMFRALAEAKKRTDDPAVLARIHDLALYTQYVQFFDTYRNQKGTARQAAFETMIRHGYRMRNTMLIHAKALYRDVDSRDKSVSIPANARWTTPEATNPWKSSKLFSTTEIASMIRDGIEANPLAKMEFAPVDYSNRLAPARDLKLAEVKPGPFHRGRGTQTMYTWIDKPNGTVTLNITGGLIAHYRDRGNVRIAMWKMSPEEKLVAQDRSVSPDGKERRVTLKSSEAGLHKITVSDGGDMTRVAWADGAPVCFKSSVDEPLKTTGRWSLYFYVPKDTKTVGFFGGKTGSIVDANGRTVYSLNGRPMTYHHVRVAPGQDGRLWKIHQAAGPIRLLTVPPYLARSADELLLPVEVLQRDK